MEIANEKCHEEDSKVLTFGGVMIEQNVRSEKRKLVLRAKEVGNRFQTNEQGRVTRKGEKGEYALHRIHIIDGSQNCLPALKEQVLPVSY